MPLNRALRRILHTAVELENGDALLYSIRLECGKYRIGIETTNILDFLFYLIKISLCLGHLVAQNCCPAPQKKIDVISR